MDPKEEKQTDLTVSPDTHRSIDEDPLAATQKTFWERSWPTFACGAGLWSDGYLQYVSRSHNNDPLVLVGHLTFDFTMS